MPIVWDVSQGTDEWFDARLGSLTSSHAAEMMATGRGGKEAAGRRNLRIKLVLERITGKIQEQAWTTKAMERGTDLEPDACAHYEALTGNMVEPIGFYSLKRCMAGGSPDGLIGADGLVEVKCPLAATHYTYLTSGKIPGNYAWQNLHNLWVSGREWLDWMSFHPDFPGRTQALLIRTERDDQVMAEYEERALEFLAEVDAQEQKLREMASDDGLSSTGEEQEVANREEAPEGPPGGIDDTPPPAPSPE